MGAKILAPTRTCGWPFLEMAAILKNGHHFENGGHFEFGKAKFVYSVSCNCKIILLNFLAD